MGENDIKNIVIVGGGKAGWMSAALLSKTLGKKLKIKLIESDGISTVGVGETTIPPFKLFNNIIGLNEDEFLKSCKGTFMLGTQFKDWGEVGEKYLHAYGALGRNVGFIHFYQYWLRSQKEGNQTDIWSYSKNAQAAMMGKFSRQSSGDGATQPDLSYAFHFDAKLYAAFLRDFCEKAGVERIEGKVVDTNLRAKDGFIESVVMENGDVIEGDMFIDCTGFKAVLIEGALKTGYENWNQWLPCNKGVIVPSENTGPLPPYTEATAQSAGWQWRIPLQHRTGNGHIYCSELMSDDEAAAILNKNLKGKPLSDPTSIKFTTGRRNKFWNKNCLAIGWSASFLEPLESTSVHLIQSGIVKLISLFPDKGFSQINIDEYNRQAITELEGIRNFLILHYKTSRRTDSPFWKKCQEMKIPVDLANKIKLFKDTGRIFHEDQELFTEAGWLQIMLGQGLKPQTYHPLANMLTTEQLTEYMTNIEQITKDAVDTMPAHDEFIAKNCTAEKDKARYVVT